MKVHICFFIIILTLYGCNTELQHGLQEDEANQIVNLLRSFGIDAKKDNESGSGQEQSWKISVPSNDATKAGEILEQYNFPRQRSDSLSSVFSGSSLIPTPTEERALLMRALAGELSKSLESIDGVIEARVHLNLPQQDDILSEKQKNIPTASILIKYITKQPPYQVEDVKKLIAGAVPGLIPENVTVVKVKREPKIRISKVSDYTNVGFIKVAKSSKLYLQMTFVVLIGLNIVLAIVIIALALRLKKLKS